MQWIYKHHKSVSVKDFSNIKNTIFILQRRRMKQEQCWKTDSSSKRGRFLHFVVHSNQYFTFLEKHRHLKVTLKVRRKILLSRPIDFNSSGWFDFGGFGGFNHILKNFYSSKMMKIILQWKMWWYSIRFTKFTPFHEFKY